MIRVVGDWPPEEPLVLREITDPAVIAQIRRAGEQFAKNNAWLDAHWEEIYPTAVGKQLVVAGQEAFISESIEEALARAREAHPDDMGLIARYVSPHKGPRIYVVRG
jgi:hypothetical protein